jgi:uncharacterized protein YndB with AHSA1/START domain
MSPTEQTSSERSTLQSTFVIERTYDAAPQRVFDAWADPAAKGQWFGPPEKPGYTLEFYVGGHERFTAGGPDGHVYEFDALYQDIVPGYRILYTYDMHRDKERISVSLATVEIAAAGEGTRLTLTEHGVYLDGHDTPAQREHGTNAMIDRLGAFIVSGSESL